MKAMILKDMLCLKKQMKSLLMVLLIWLVISAATSNGLFFSVLGVVYIIMLPMTTLSYDERAGWDSRALTMPVTRAQLVVGRYITALLAGLALCAVGAVVTAVMDGVDKAPASLGFFLLGVLMLSVSMPVILKLGVEKGRLVVMLFYVVPFGALLLSEKLGLDPITALQRLDSPAALMLSAALIFLLLCVSAAVSVGIYKEKEF